MKSLKQTEKKRQIKEVTLMIDSKILSESSLSQKANLQKTLRRPLSSLTNNTNLKPKDFGLKTPTVLNLNSTIKRGGHSKSKSQEKRTNSIQRSKSLSNIADPQIMKSISFVSKQSNMKCFQKLVFKITDLLEKEKSAWKMDRLSYEIVLKILHQLHYIQYSTEKQLVENNLMEVLKKVYQFWVNLSPKSSTSLKNVIQLICVIQNISVHSDYIQSALASFKTHLQKRRSKLIESPEYILQYRFIGVTIFTDWNYDGDLILSKSSSCKIQQTFNCFKTNRLNHNQKANQDIQIQKFSLSQKTNKLALNKRQKIQTIIRNRQPNIQKITLEDILNFKEDSVINTAPLSARTYEQNKSTESRSITKRPRLKLHRKCQPFIDMLSQPKVVRILTKEQLEYQRNKQQCTFKPDINPLKINQTQNFLKIKNVVKTLERMKNTRQSKIEEIQFRETGWTNGNRRSRSKDRDDQVSILPLSARRQSKDSVIDFQTKKQSTHSQSKRQQTLKQDFCKTQQKTQSIQQAKQIKTDIKIPLLFIDINIDEAQKERLVIYEQDNSLQLAASFAKKHNLSKQMEMKLKQLLDYQMNSILTKIEEQAQQEDIF